MDSQNQMETYNDNAALNPPAMNRPTEPFQPFLRPEITGLNPEDPYAQYLRNQESLLLNDMNAKQSLDMLKQQTSALDAVGYPCIGGNNYPPNDNFGQKRKKDSENDEMVEAKKSSINNMSAEEKKTANMRKNIRDVFDENQLDTNTLAAQREESERLARVAEQQKIIRETQRQAAVNRSFVRTQNKVLSLLQSGTTFAKVTSETPFEEVDATLTESEPNASPQAVPIVSGENKLSSKVETESVLQKDVTPISPTPIDDDDDDTVKPAEEQVISDVVTIEDSSSEDDCIMLSDDEEELDDEEEVDDPSNSGLHVKDAYNVADEQGRVLVNIGHPEGEDDIFVAPQIAHTIKPHQIGGVRFLFDNIIESTKRFKSSSGFGCILSHSMGLGKTLQVICFCDIFLRHTPSKTVLCVMPINTLQNWVSEFNMWLPKYSDNSEHIRPRQFDVFILNDQHKTLSARAKVILKWAEEGGVLLIGYELFRLLALKLMSTRKRRSNKAGNCERSGTEMNRRLMESVHQALVKPGPDLVICDEGHRIKNAHAGISLALKQIRTRRRIVLTGYPLQNNLLEYWCMVDFVRPNYLGTRNEFCNMFERPIQNGQCIDSTPEDHKLMRYRAHVLHSLLLGFVQRRSHVVLQQTLPKKLEYVILTRMTAFQRQLYDTFMNDIVRTKSVPNPLKAFAVCCKIWNHPDVLYSFLKRKEIDLELEMEESEVIGEPATTTTAPAIAVKMCEVEKSTPLEDKPTNEAVVNEPMCQDVKPKEDLNSDTNSPASECKQVDQQSPADMTQRDGQALVANKPNTEFSNLMKSSLLSDHYNQQQHDVSSYLGANGNNYWQESNVNYFNYQTVSDNIESLSKPNYVGMVPQRAEETPNEATEGGGSSQIVDLDTKEIKTVETDIDMTLCPVIKNEALGDNSMLANAKGEGATTTGSTDAVIEDIKMLTSTNSIGNEKDVCKVKPDETTLHEWAIDLMKKYRPGLLENSPKMEILFCILNESVKFGDRVLLFSQSLLTLNLIETFLQMTHMPDSELCWGRGVSYFRLDGSTTSQERERLVNEFNSNANVKLFLISTRAGSLGINLVGANRVIVFDASWNPCHDTQAVYRIYRYGQIKPCFVYRIVMDKCLEKKIYDRQIKKQGMSDRVVDECNPDAHLSIRDITNLCHDYDDDDKSQSEVPEFTTPLDSFEDVLIRKIVEQHKGGLSKEPFFHESLLIDRKEKKLSQAEKRQAHRGYEMEKKASVKQNFSVPIKNQYRIVRNDGSIVTRPVASIRPMQTTKTTTATKSGGIRTTRWIPAEVWQRQGMTAQEMTLPLDVVIPTHSNDKSNIILKSGQRVMVLKSAKGIYMQLESGKIIAIRTSSKAAEVNKTDKDEVIDITNEGDNTTEKRGEEGKTETANQKESDSTAKGSQNSCTETTEKSAGYDKCINNNTKKLVESNSTKGKEFVQPNQYKTDMQMQKDDINSKFDSLKKVEQKTSQQNIEKVYASHTNDNTTKQEFTNTARSCQKVLAPKPPQQVDDGVALKSHESNHHQPQQQQQQLLTQHQEPEKEKKDSMYPLKHGLDKNNPPQTTLLNQQQKCLPQYNNKPLVDPAPYPYKQMGNYPFCGLTPPDLSKYANQRGDMMTTPTESFQTCNYNKRKLQKELPIPTDYTPSPTSSSSSASAASTASSTSQNQSLKHSHLNAAAATAHQSPYSQSPYSSLFHQQQQPKLHLYGSNYNLDNEHYSNLAQTSHSSQSLNQNHSLIGDTFGAVQENSTSLMHTGGQNVSAPCDYSTHFPDYAAYSSYNHPHYFPHFANSYGNGSSAPIGTNPYHQMHWSPLIAPTSINEQCNPVHSSVYPQNGAQHNQWHHKL